MSALHKQFETDPKIEKEGVWITYEGDEDEAPSKFLIARAGGANVEYTKAMERESKPIRRKLQNDLVSTTALRKLTIKVFSETVVLGWENVTDKAGNVLAFTPENVVKLFTELPDLFDDVHEQANRAALYRKSLQELDAKN